MGEKIPLVVVLGPTACGKTGLAVDLALCFGGEVIGADSMQIYKRMKIGSAKPSKEEMRGVPHHLIDFLDQSKAFSVAQYVALAKLVISDIRDRQKLPILCGGTGLYINSLIGNISFEENPDSSRIREKLKAAAAEKGASYLFDKLKKSDPKTAEKLHPNNLGRVIRALEVFEATGETMSERQQKTRQRTAIYNPCMIGLCYRDRGKLYAKINARVDAMIADGLIDEAKNLFASGLSGTAGQAIGYKELKNYLDGRESLKDAVDQIKQETRRYSKRQMTWFRRDTRITWIYRDDCDDDVSVRSKAIKIVETFMEEHA